MLRNIIFKFIINIIFIWLYDCAKYTLFDAEAFNFL